MDEVPVHDLPGPMVVLEISWTVRSFALQDCGRTRSAIRSAALVVPVVVPLRLAARYVIPHLGTSHKLDVGARWLVDGVTNPTLSIGVFYASTANTLMVAQADTWVRDLTSDANKRLHQANCMQPASDGLLNVRFH